VLTGEILALVMPLLIITLAAASRIGSVRPRPSCSDPPATVRLTRHHRGTKESSDDHQ
jgi:hypothetical protein